MSGSAKDQLDHIYQCFKQMDDLFHSYAAERNLSDSAFWILYALCETEKPYTQNELCEEWHYTKQTVHSAVASLTSAGYIRLEHLPGSRNSKSIVLTSAGRGYVSAHIRPLLRAELRVFAQLSAQERADYLRLAQKHAALLSQAVCALKKK